MEGLGVIGGSQDQGLAVSLKVISIAWEFISTEVALDTGLLDWPVHL